MSDILDISLPIYAGMPVYPGTAETEIKEVKSGSGSSVLSEITMTSHAGTHIDAPSHSVAGGQSIDEFDLSVFYGPCRVLDLTACQTAVTKADLAGADIQKGERILLKTHNSVRGFADFYPDFVYLEPEAAAYLAEQQIALVGVDALSVKQRGAPDNSSHTNLLAKNIAIVEGLNLAEVEAGSYTLVALPLAFRGLDGSPARAVLLPLA
jgi:arylformamidase